MKPRALRRGVVELGRCPSSNGPNPSFVRRTSLVERRSTPIHRGFKPVGALGVQYVVDPQFDYGPFVTALGRYRHGRHQVELDAAIALSDNNQRIGAGYTAFFVGEGERGRSLYARTKLTYHRFGSDGFRHLTGELLVGGRLPLRAIGPSLRGMFLEAEFGLGLQSFGFDALGGGLNGAVNGMLLFRSAYGFYLGDRGELALFYDHRRDGFAGALGVDSVAAGTPGHVGVSGEGFFGGGPWGLRAEAAFGGAHVYQLALVRRGTP